MTQTKSKVGTALKKASEKKPKTKMTNKDYVAQMLPAISKAVPSTITPERFSRIVLTALSSNPQLQQCTPESFMGAMMTAAQLGLEPNTPLGQAYLIPYRNKGKLECQFQLGYQGAVTLAYRSGQIQSIQAHTVYKNDFFEFEYGLEPKLKHKPALEDRGEPVAFYAVFHTKDGGYSFEVMSKEDIDAHAKKYSKNFGSAYSPWKTSYLSMAKKTVLKQVLKYAPTATDFARSLSADETIKKVTEDVLEDADIDVIDLPNEVDFEVEPEETDAGPEPVEDSFEPVQQSIGT